MELPIVKKLCGDNQPEAASLIKELVKNMEEISKLTLGELVRKPDPHLEETLRHIKSLARDSIDHARSK